MSVRMRHTRAHTRNRRSHHSIREVNFGACGKCGAPALPHTLCTNCGAYKGKEIVDVLKKLDKKERKRKERELKEKEMAEDSKRPLDAAKLSKK